MQVKHPEWQKMLPRRNWCEVAPYEAGDGEADDPRAKGALVRLAPGCLFRVSQFRSRAARRAVAHGLSHRFPGSVWMRHVYQLALGAGLMPMLLPCTAGCPSSPVHQALPTPVECGCQQ